MLSKRFEIWQLLAKCHFLLSDFIKLNNLEENWQLTKKLYKLIQALQDETSYRNCHNDKPPIFFRDVNRIAILESVGQSIFRCWANVPLHASWDFVRKQFWISTVCWRPDVSKKAIQDAIIVTDQSYRQQGVDDVQCVSASRGFYCLFLLNSFARNRRGNWGRTMDKCEQRDEEEMHVAVISIDRLANIAARTRNKHHSYQYNVPAYAN